MDTRNQKLESGKRLSVSKAMPSITTFLSFQSVRDQQSSGLVVHLTTYANYGFMTTLSNGINGKVSKDPTEKVEQASYIFHLLGNFFELRIKF